MDNIVKFLNSQWFELVIGIPSAIALLSLIILIPLLHSKVVKPLDQQFKGKGLSFEEGLWYVSFFIRASQYTLCIVFPNRSKSDKYAKLVYEGYDFRGNATKTQVYLSYWYLIILIIFVIATILFSIREYIAKPLAGA